jgi:hypothetical protein
MSCIIKIKRFILKGATPRSLCSLGAFRFTSLGLGIMPDLLQPHEIGGQVVGIVIDSIVEYLSEQGKDFKGSRTYPLSSQMTHLAHETDVPLSCGPEDVDFKAFLEATSLIGGRDAVEEFLASGLQPLGQRFGFFVETKESPLSKVSLPMP